METQELTTTTITSSSSSSANLFKRGHSHHSSSIGRRQGGGQGRTMCFTSRNNQDPYIYFDLLNEWVSWSLSHISQNKNNTPNIYIIEFTNQCCHDWYMEGHNKNNDNNNYNNKSISDFWNQPWICHPLLERGNGQTW